MKLRSWLLLFGVVILSGAFVVGVVTLVSFVIVQNARDAAVLRQQNKADAQQEAYALAHPVQPHDYSKDPRLSPSEYPCSKDMVGYGYCTEVQHAITKIGTKEQQVQYLTLVYCQQASDDESTTALDYIYGSIYGYATESPVPSEPRSGDTAPYWHPFPGTDVESISYGSNGQPALDGLADPFCPKAMAQKNKIVTAG